ncbi:MAG: sigma-70 family RNA polymerase sigma factor [Myxococcales bacterium]
MTEPKLAVEEAIRAAWDAREYQQAATLALEAYGAEIYSFVHARLRSGADADDAFSIFAEDLWKGLPGFEYRSSMRGWLYALARNAANRHATSPQRRAERNIPLSFDSAVSALAVRSRTETQLHHQGDAKDKIRALRKRLPIDDQTLLILFVDRSLPWREIAQVMHDQDTPLDPAELTREAARLRKRFERVKAELKAMALAEGLLKR